MKGVVLLLCEIGDGYFVDFNVFVICNWRY